MNYIQRLALKHIRLSKELYLQILPEVDNSPHVGSEPHLGATVGLQQKKKKETYTDYKKFSFLVKRDFQ